MSLPTGQQWAMHLAPAVTVHSAPQARAAIAAAGAEGVLLLSAPWAAGYLGPAWFAAIVGDHHPAALDCGADPGYALAALRHGFRLIILRNATPVLESCAEEVGAQILAVRPPSLDLLEWRLERPRAQAALRAWLEAARS